MTDHVSEQIGVNDLRRLDEYRRRHNTAILVIMFTDLEGSTQISDSLGDRYADSLRKTHDAILVPIITRKEQGLLLTRT
jgi:class 3 adenylate cyclase